ncbi:MAG: GNAT family N-acetyltransferase [Sarcina sp.]
MKIRFATLKDLNICTELDLHNNKNFIKRKIQEKEVIVYEDFNETIIACLKFEYLWTHMPFISYIIVKNEHRKKGIAKNLLNFFEDYLSEKGHKFILSSTMTNAINSQNWHTKMKFKECGHIAGINDGIGELFYIKNI